MSAAAARSGPSGAGVPGETPGRTAHERRRHIVAVATRLFGERPEDELTVPAVAHAAGVPVAAVQHLYARDAELLPAAVAYAVDEIGERVLPYLDLPPREAAVRSVGAYVAWLDGHADAYARLIAIDPLDPAADDVIRGVAAQTERLILGELYYPHVEDAPAPVRHAVVSWLRTMHTAIGARIALGAPRADELAEQLVDELAAALRDAGDGESAERLAT